MLENKDNSILSLPGVTHLTYNDEELIRLSFPKDSIQYARSFLYLLRTAHGEKGSIGYKYMSSKITAVIGYRKNLVYVTPITDVTYGKELQKLCQQISSTLKCRLLIKKYSPNAYPYLKSIKNVRLNVKELEDGAFPETVLLLQRIFINKQGDVNPTAKKFLKQLRRFNRLKLHYEILDEITPVQMPKIEEFLKKDPEKYANYLPMVNYLSNHKRDIKYKTMLFEINNQIEGIYITEIYSLTEAGLYCAVTAKNKPGITEWMDWYFFKFLYQEGIEALYFGGSETKGVDYYIKKLNPINPSYYVETIEYETNLNSTQPAQNKMNTQRIKEKAIEKSKSFIKKMKFVKNPSIFTVS